MSIYAGVINRYQRRVHQRASSRCGGSGLTRPLGRGDLLFGSLNNQIVTLVERQTRYLMLVKVASKDAQAVINALIKNARKLPQELYKSSGS